MIERNPCRNYTTIFSGLSHEAEDEFRTIAVRRTYLPGTVLLDQGTEAPGVFLLVNGQVKLSVGSRSGRHLLVRLAEAPDALGLSAVILNSRSEVIAETVCPCDSDFVPAEAFREFLRRYPAATWQATQALCGTYRHLDRERQKLAFGGLVVNRLADLLLCMTEQPAGQHSSKALSMTTEEMASTIATKPQTITLALLKLEDLGIVARSSAGVSIHDRESLKEVALRSRSC